MAADVAACRSLLGLTDLMGAASFAATARVPVVPPTESILRVPNNGEGLARAVSARELVLEYRTGPGESRLWRLVAAGGVVTLRFGKVRLNELHKGFSDMAAGDGDWSIVSDEETDDDSSLSFWWHPETPRPRLRDRPL